MTSYDVVPYTCHPYQQSHPDRLASIATLFGLSPPPVEQSRVLELGCASGGNIIPMAEQFPQSQFLGIDSSTVQVSQANRIIERLGLTNIRVECQDIMAFPLQGKPFDYIVSHGVYSWVPPQVQDRILEISGARLAENGVVYISYNTFPGWHLRLMIRDIMRFRAKSFTVPEQRLAQARGLLAFLSSAVQGEDSPYSKLLAKELENINRYDEAYLHHEHLEDVNAPCYFFEIIEKAQAKGLQYLAEADIGSISLANLPEKTRAMLQGVSNSLIELEQYMDFLRNRGFRETLLCRESIPVERKISAQAIMRLRLASAAAPVEPLDDLRATEQTTFKRGQSTMRTNDPIVRAAFLELGKAWPRAIPFPELASIAKSMVTGHHAAVDSGVLGASNERFAETMIRCCETPMVDLHTVQPTFILEDSDRPKASTFARAQARSTARVTNLQHASVIMDDFERHVLVLLDGTRTKQEVADELVSGILRGELIVYHQKSRITTADSARLFVDSHLDATLQRLRQQAFIVA